MFLLLGDKNDFNMYFTSMDFIYFLSLCVSLMQSNIENVFLLPLHRINGIFLQKKECIVKKNFSFLCIYIK